MAVRVGSARIDENNKAHGGKAGNQTGKELSFQNWYKHSKGWRVLRCTDAEKADRIALAMERACNNRNIGYDQYQRLTLFEQAKDVDFDPGKVTVPCETDCSALVRVCLAYAGITVGNFRTPTQANMMLATGQFVELKGAKYTDSPQYLRRGDVLVTRTQGHTVVVLNDGDKADGDDPLKPLALGDRLLKKGSEGADVKALQQHLLDLGYALPKYGADADFGSETERAVIAFQKKFSLEQDGQYGKLTHAALMKAVEEKPEESQPEEPQPAEPKPVGTTVVAVSEGSIVNIRKGNGTEYAVITTTTPGTTFDHVATAANGWHAIVVNGQVGWVSGKYSKVI